MIHQIGEFILRPVEQYDLSALYEQKNDPEIAEMLGGFSTGYSHDDLREWLEFHRKRTDEVIWAIAEAGSNRCLGHVGLYRIDYRVRTAEFAILIGDRSCWGKGLGRACTRYAVDYGFNELNLNRISLEVLESNTRAQALYTRIGFQVEGHKRHAQYRDGCYVDMVLMSVIRDEYRIDS